MGRGLLGLEFLNGLRIFIKELVLLAINYSLWIAHLVERGKIVFMQETESHEEHSFFIKTMASAVLLAQQVVMTILQTTSKYPAQKMVHMDTSQFTSLITVCLTINCFFASCTDRENTPNLSDRYLRKRALEHQITKANINESHVWQDDGDAWEDANLGSSQDYRKLVVDSSNLNTCSLVKLIRMSSLVSWDNDAGMSHYEKMKFIMISWGDQKFAGAISRMDPKEYAVIRSILSSSFANESVNIKSFPATWLIVKE